MLLQAPGAVICINAIVGTSIQDSILFDMLRIALDHEEHGLCPRFERGHHIQCSPKGNKDETLLRIFGNLV
jgi:hypothetical protein